MKKHFKLWAMSDALTKIGCGVYGGAMVSYFYNLSLGKEVDLKTHLFFVGLGSCALIAGYLGIWLAKHPKNPL